MSLVQAPATDITTDEVEFLTWCLNHVETCAVEGDRSDARRLLRQLIAKKDWIETHADTVRAKLVALPTSDRYAAVTQSLSELKQAGFDTEHICAAICEWHTGEPPMPGYYLATWLFAGSPTVSELWFNPAETRQKWWVARRYLGEASEDFSPVGKVLAWRPMPTPWK